MYYCYLDTPIGDLLLAGDEEALCLIGFPEGSKKRNSASPPSSTTSPPSPRTRTRVTLKNGSTAESSAPSLTVGVESTIHSSPSAQSAEWFRTMTTPALSSTS